MLDAERCDRSGILVLHRDPTVQQAVQRYLRTTLRPIFLASNPDDARAALAHHPELIVVEHAAIADDAPEFLAEAAAAGVRLCVSALGPGVAAPSVPSSFDSFALSSLGALGPPRGVDELAVTALKLLRRDLFGMEKYLRWGFVPVEHRLTCASDRHRLLAALAGYLTERGFSSRLRWLAAQTADELISNALFHGPVDSSGRHVRSHLPRAGDFELGPDEEVVIRYGSDDSYFAIEVADRWGSLDVATLTHCLHRAVAPGPLPRPKVSGGAGLGLALAAGYVQHLVCNLEPGHRTELIALFDVRGTVVRLELAPSFHAFVVPEAAPADPVDAGGVTA